VTTTEGRTLGTATSVGGAGVTVWFSIFYPNPLKYTDPDGKKLNLYFFVAKVTENESGGRTANGFMIVYNTDTKQSFMIDNVVSGGKGINVATNKSEHAPFGTYDILETTSEGKLYQRLEAQDNKYGDDKATFNDQNENSLIRLHYRGSGLTWGCVSIPDEDAAKILTEMDSTSTTKVNVDSKSRNPLKRLFKETQIKYGELKIIDATGEN
ncbi:MAG: hypothetical protein LBG80_10770, partial [Bacteroidales bacterium]|jgi:hypothetical protein|nr:hypothetical protein [Bacteroidales bacterium]